MATEIRGPTDAQTQMILGQIRQVFDPDWLQAFDRGGFTVQFVDEPDSEDELINFADMYGYSLHDERDGEGWREYTFK